MYSIHFDKDKKKAFDYGPFLLVDWDRGKNLSWPYKLITAKSNSPTNINRLHSIPPFFLLMTLGPGSLKILPSTLYIICTCKVWRCIYKKKII